MARTQNPYRWSRADVRIHKLGINPAGVSREASLLFDARAKMRRVVRVLAAGLIVLLAVLPTGSALSLPDQASAALLQGYAFRMGVATALIGVVLALSEAVVRGWDRRLARRLPARVTRAEAVPLTVIVGKVRVGYIGVVSLGQAVMLTATFVAPISDVAAYRWGYLIAFTVCLATAVTGILRAAHRPGVAIDALSLALDERLRSQDALEGAYPMMGLTIIATFSLVPFDAPGWLRTLGYVVSGVSYVMWIWAGEAKPWPKPVTTRPQTATRPA